ncbi:TraR/DksA family transcriptional regulator [Leucobacter luti]|uniref:TraR/DksA family transcriptional regulator n=1 Tax=Leucobacter luti TaxID=340320 RepID=UPI001045A1D4|nr:TraR/DksA C4-type zinc finger protein [Leucobacter luti]MCW2288047.1 RNA polymerase-binding transcription factor DksA [Leucobacter luti]TCK45791.1 TraR/DksA family transcriptional regulator [Leucobacter luti]
MARDTAQREVLVQEQKYVLARVAILEAQLEALIRTRRSESDDDEHDPEGETLSSQWSMLVGLLDAAREDATLAERALMRFEAGDYGICQLCGQPIPIGQLEARPFRESCVSCPR